MVAPEPPFALPPPPPDRGRGGRISFYVLSLAAIGLGSVAGAPVALAFALPLAGFAWLLVVARRREIGSALATAALDRAARGRFDEARALLDGVAKNVLSSHVGIMVDSQRAALALYEGDLEGAVAEATKGVREGKRLGALAEIYRGSALSLRAVALAALGRKDEALADVAKVRSSPYRQAIFLARAALAEALLFAREKNLEALGKLLREERRLLLGATSPRERMIVRALSRMVAAKKVSVYREPAKREEEAPDQNASWVARIAPEAASYARAPKLGDRLQAPPALDPAAIAKADASAPRPRRASKRAALALLVVLVALGIVLLQILPERAGPSASAMTISPSSELGSFLVVLAGVMAIFAVSFASARRAAKAAFAELRLARELPYRGQHAEAKRRLEALSKSKVLLVKPQAECELASLANAEGDFATARRHAEAGIAATLATSLALTLSRALVLPTLHGELAFALAASRDPTKAERELAQIPIHSPAYPYLARDTFRVRLVGLASKGRFEEAAEMARSRPVELPLTMDEELLCDALRVWAGDMLPDGERERIVLELRDDVGPVRFLDRVAPGLRAAIHDRPYGVRVATRGEVAVDHDDDRSAADEEDDRDSAPLEALRSRPVT